MLQISTQFPTRVRRQDGETGLVMVRLQLALSDPFAVELIILQEEGNFGWQLAAEDLTAAIRRPGRSYGLGVIQIKSKESRKFVHITLPAGAHSSIKLRCPWNEVEQFIRLLEQVVKINDLLPWYLKSGYRALEDMLRKQ